MSDMVRKGSIAKHGAQRAARFDPLANRRAQQERMRQQANDTKKANLFGGKKKRRTYKKRRHSRKSLKKRIKTRRNRRKCCPGCKRYCSKSCPCKPKCKKYCGCKCPKCPTKKRSRRHRMKGGYSQFMSNIPYSASYSTGGNLSPSDLGLANPVPHQRFINCPGK